MSTRNFIPQYFGNRTFGSISNEVDINKLGFPDPIQVRFYPADGQMLNFDRSMNRELVHENVIAQVNTMPFVLNRQYNGPYTKKDTIHGSPEDYLRFF